MTLRHYRTKTWTEFAKLAYIPDIWPSSIVAIRNIPSAAASLRASNGVGSISLNKNQHDSYPFGYVRIRLSGYS
eukprot:2241866-Pleurochrysis_carterae.AAC.1